MHAPIVVTTSKTLPIRNEASVHERRKTRAEWRGRASSPRYFSRCWKAREQVPAKSTSNPRWLTCVDSFVRTIRSSRCDRIQSITIECDPLPSSLRMRQVDGIVLVDHAFHDHSFQKGPIDASSLLFELICAVVACPTNGCDNVKTWTDSTSMPAKQERRERE